MAKVTAGNGGLIFDFKYHPAIVDGLKAQIPPTDRKFDPAAKNWIISPKYGKVIQDLVLLHLGETILLPVLSNSNIKILRVIEVRYIGGCKARDDSSVSAFGWAGNQWSVVFPEQTLRDWFEAGPSSEPVRGTDTLYSVLGIPRRIGAEDIKTAYFRVAKQVHPDHNKEPDAHEQFLKVQHAYAVLSNPNQRARYDAGLALEASIKKQERTPDYSVSAGAYRSPLKNGLIMVKGVETIGRVIVSKIMAWEDITDAQGRVLVSSWAIGAKVPTEVWC